MTLLSFSFSKYIFLPWQKTYCRKRKSPFLGPYRTDRWDDAKKNLLENAFFYVSISERSVSAGRAEGDRAVFCGSESKVLSGCYSEPLQWNVGRCVHGRARIIAGLLQSVHVSIWHKHLFLWTISILDLKPATIFNLFPQSCYQSFAGTTLLPFWM